MEKEIFIITETKVSKHNGDLNSAIYVAEQMRDKHNIRVAVQLGKEHICTFHPLK